MRFAWKFIQVIFKLILVFDAWGIFCETVLRWTSLYLINDLSIGSGIEIGKHNEGETKRHCADDTFQIHFI